MSTTHTQQLSYEGEYFKNTKVIDNTYDTPNIHLSNTFQCVRGIIGRVTPSFGSESRYVLDFVRPDGQLVEDPIFDVWDMYGGLHGPSRILAVGAPEGIHTQMYYITKAKRYEVRSREHGYLIKTISFPHVVLLE